MMLDLQLKPHRLQNVHEVSSSQQELQEKNELMNK